MSKARSRHAALPLAELIGSLVTPACRRRGIASAALMLDPADIFGERFAKAAAIERIVWPKGSRLDEQSSHGATLIVRADAAAAIALQHTAPQVIERVNVMIGWPAIARLRVTQVRGRAHREPAYLTPVPPPQPPRDEARAAAIAEAMQNVEHPQLKAALSRLGASIETRSLSQRRKPT
ncbi:DciA family protein [Acuticoccus sediminis]|nr:DciA family protein [Acuticoccus sediminis]